MSQLQEKSGGGSHIVEEHADPSSTTKKVSKRGRKKAESEKEVEAEEGAQPGTILFFLLF